MAIFNSYVSLPEGISSMVCSMFLFPVIGNPFLLGISWVPEGTGKIGKVRGRRDMERQGST